MDVLWTYFPGADPEALLVKYGDRFKLIHVKDLRKGIKGNLSGTTPTENDCHLRYWTTQSSRNTPSSKKSGVMHFIWKMESPIYYLQVPKSIKFLENLEND